MQKWMSGLFAIAIVGCTHGDGGGIDVTANDVQSSEVQSSDVRDVIGATDAGSVDTTTLDIVAPTDTARTDTGAVDTGLADAGTVRADVPIIVRTYVSANRTITSGGVVRPFVVAHPEPMPSSPLPLVFSLHGDGGNGTGMRTALPLEGRAMGRAVFVYPSAPGGSFEYWTSSGRAAEAQFVRDVIALLHTEIGIDTGRVFVTGMSGGATMANALGCRLGPTVIHGLGIHSGTLYPVNDSTGHPDFTYTGSGGVSCTLPPTLFVWGAADVTDGVSFTQGQGVRDNYVATQSCASTTMPWSTSPCVAYDGCSSAVVWCPIPGMGHSIWPGAAGAIWSFFDGVP